MVAAHAREPIGVLHHHHSNEDQLIWPKLRARRGLDTGLAATRKSNKSCRAFLAHIPPPIRLAYRLVGRRKQQREIAQLRGQIV